jgi:hypothetical protein
MQRLTENLLVYILCAVVISGCGYTTGSMLPADIKTIYVAPFKNKINLTEELDPYAYRYRAMQPHIDVDVTNKVVDEFMADGNLRLSRKDNADVILSGEIVNFYRQPITYQDDRQIEEFRLSIVTNISLYDTRKEKVLWREQGLIGDTIFTQSGTYAESESSALADAIEDLARRVVERTVEGW